MYILRRWCKCFLELVIAEQGSESGRPLVLSGAEDIPVEEIILAIDFSKSASALDGIQIEMLKAMTKCAVDPEQTPYDIRTYKGPAYEDIPRPVTIDPCCYGAPLKPCRPGKAAVTKPMTTEEAIFQLFEIPQKPRFQLSAKKKCKNLDIYNTCVMDQRSPATLKHHALVREKYLRTKEDIGTRVHDAKEPSSDEASLIQMDSPVTIEGKVLPKPCSPACSLDTFYVPSRKLLDLKRPKSGIFINETPRPVDSEIPYETYDPRKLQAKLESEARKKYTLLSDGERFYFPWIAEQENAAEPRMDEIEALRENCIHFKPVIFPIPEDLHKTFRAAVVFANTVMPAYEDTTGPHRPTEVACLYAAYVESFKRNPDYWSANTMDSLLKAGEELCKQSIEIKYEDPDSDFDIFPELTEKQALITTKLHLTGMLQDEPNILKALSLFFSKYHAGILVCESLYFLIWKRCTNSFYIFDPNGRNVYCKRDFEEGFASLMAVQTVEHIVHLILNYSDVDSKAEFNLYAIHLKDFGKLSKPFSLPPLKQPKKLYAVVNRYYAIIPALSGLNTPAPKSKSDNPSMMVSFLGLVYSQMDPPKLWTMQLVDDLIKFGRQYYSDYISDNRLKELNIADLPEVLLFGNYRVLVEKQPFVESGHVVDCWSYRVSSLSIALNEFLTEHNSGLVQIDSSTFALWKENCMIFVLDCFKRGPSGQATRDPKPKAGCLQIHLNLDSVCRVMFMNSVAVKQEGNFFIHAIRIKAIGTFNVNAAMEGNTTFGQLKIKYPFDCDKPKLSGDDDGPLSDACPDAPKSMPARYSLVQCLSELSLNPCERTCSERDFLLHQKMIKKVEELQRPKSIQSIPAEYRLPDFDDVDVIDSVVGEFICDIMTKIEKRYEKKKSKVSIQASKILLQSDRGYLEDLKLRVKHGQDYDNICAAFRTKPKPYKPITLEEELAMDSNFTALPDGSWAIFGISDMDSKAQPLKGILSVICATALSSKYKVSTWSSDVIEYAIEASKILEEHFWSYNHTLEMIFRKSIPKIKLGSNTFFIRVLNTETVTPDKLKTTIEDALLKVNRLFLICKGLSCLILRRYNLMYMFMGCPCDFFGFRAKSHGPMCMLRFLELGSLVRRIDNACGMCGKYVVVQLEVKDLTQPRERFWSRSMSQENLIYNRELSEKQKEKKRYKDKIDFLQHEIKKEAKRVKEFQKEKVFAKRRGEKRGKRSSTSATETEMVEGAEEGLFDESEGSVEYKHKPGKSLEPPEEEDMSDETLALPTLGYQIRDNDFLFKIQGTTALEDRKKSSTEEIKICFFASTIALLYAVLRPLNHWDARRVDKVIHVAQNVARGTSNLKTVNERFIKNIDADEFTFHVKVETFTPLGTFGGTLEYKIKKTVQQQKYFLIQISNCTFAIYHDRYYHVFDPYPSMEVMGAGSEPEEIHDAVPDNIPLNTEQNTASWVLLPDLTAMMSYIGKRAASTDWKNEYQLHILSIVNYKSAPKRVQLLNLLTDEFENCVKTPEMANLCTHPEEIEWLDIYPNLVIWSRLNQSNAVQRVRGSPLTKDRNFDVEIPDRLFSLWGSLHPISGVFGESRGKQHLAICVVACCVADVYQVHEWNTQIIDSIVINGNDYYNESINTIRRRDYEISIEHLNTVFRMGHIRFEVHVESVTYGYLYTREKNELNLAAALTYFFTHHRYGVIQCMKRSVAIGKLDNGFFIFECQSYGLPLFHSGQGAAYIMRTTQLQILLYCIVMTLNLPYFNAQFTIHKVEMLSEKIEAQDDGEEVDDE